MREAANCCLTAILDLNEAVLSDQVAARRLVRRGEDGSLQALYPAYVDARAPVARGPVRDLTMVSVLFVVRQTGDLCNSSRAPFMASDQASSS